MRRSEDKTQGEGETTTARSSYPEIYKTVAGGFGRIAKEIPGPFASFRQLHVNAVEDGVLSKKYKELIALVT